MTLSSDMVGAITVFMIIFRWFAVSLASVMVLGAFIEMIMPGRKPRWLSPVYYFICRVSMPVKHLLPRRLKLRRWDFSPLITACLLLSVYIGLSWIVRIFMTGS